MKNTFVKGLVTAGLYYAVAGIIYMVIDRLNQPSYAHGPNIQHFFAFIMLVVGAFWLLKNLLTLAFERNVFVLGSLIIHVLVLSAFGIWLVKAVGDEGH